MRGLGHVACMVEIRKIHKIGMENLKEQTTLRAQPKTFFSDGIKKLVGHWEKCIAKQGDYVEK